MRGKQFVCVAAAAATAGTMLSGYGITTAEAAVAKSVISTDKAANKMGTKAAYNAPADMKVASNVYGWALSDASVTEGNQVTVTIMPAGQSAPATFTTAVAYGVTNAMTNTTQAKSIASRCVKGAMVEICLNAQGEVIDMRRVVQGGLNFDTAKFGGDLTEIGSTVEQRGASYKDLYNNNATGQTGALTGLSGKMVSQGWLLEKDGAGKTITVGDGNRTADVFNETYAVSDQVKVYQVNNYVAKKNETADFSSTPITFADLQASALNNGVIYNTPSESRNQVIVVFDSDYTKVDTAKVVEIYAFSNHEDVEAFVGKIPQSVRTGSDVSETTQGNPAPRTAPYLVAANPISVVDGKMWTIGDIEDNCPVFKGGTDASMGKSGGGDWLVQFDTGWPADGYQYMKNIEKVGLDPRDLDMLLVPHGHGDHYGALYDEWEMIVRSGAGAPIVYESYEDTMGYDIYGYPEIGSIYDDHAVKTIITDWYPMDQWIDLGDGLQMQVTLTPGHSQGAGSCVFQVTAGEKMEGAKLTYEKDANGNYTTSYGDYNVGDEIFFCYMGGYGINGLDSVTEKGFLRNAFVGSLRYIESVLTNLKTTTGNTPDGIYNLAQHTNQYPYTETAYVMNKYNKEHGTSYPFLRFMREGREEVINFCEKRASAMQYAKYTEQYLAAYESTDSKYSIDGKSEKKANTSPYFDYDGVRIKTDITSPKIKNNTIEDAGPFKHAGGETTIQIAEDVDVLVMHGYDVYLNKGIVPAGTYMTTSGDTKIADQNFDMAKGFAFAKDGFVAEPDQWFVQIGAHVQDDYKGVITSNEGPNAGITLKSGPVEAFRGDGWSEIIRTEGMTKEQAEAMAASLKKGAYYKVNLKKTGDIINAANVMDTFVETTK